VVGVDGTMLRDALWAHEFQAGIFGAEVGDGFLLVLFAGLIVVEIGLHVFQGERLFHLLIMKIDGFERSISLS
jgi:hypothetical protein